jgi:hypothetical protein
MVTLFGKCPVAVDVLASFSHAAALDRKIVNGLRDDDNDSIYSLGRNSIASDYSTHESGENMQVFVKEHVRTGSKGSQASIASRKKVSGGKPRPETKVNSNCASSLAHAF